MAYDCTIFLDIDGVVNFRQPEGPGDVYQEPTGNWQHHRYLSHRTPEFVENVRMLVVLTGARLVCCSTWRLGRTLAELNGITSQVFGHTFPRFDDKLRDLLPDETWGMRDQLILDHVASSPKACQYWLAVDDLTLPVVPEAHHVRPKVGEGFGITLLAEAFDKLVKQ